MQLRRFNQRGIEAFRQLLSACRQDAKAEMPSDLVEHPEYTELVAENVILEPRRFTIRRQAAEYFHQKFREIDKQLLMYDQGMWSWLSLYYFDSVCPRVNGKRILRNDPTYILEPRRNFFRHLLSIAWRILDFAPLHNRLLLDTSVSKLDQFSAEVLNRLYLTRIPCFFELLEILYMDESTGKCRKQVVGTKVYAGDLTHRLPLRIRQLEKNYDLYSLSAQQLLELLGNEFTFRIEAKRLEQSLLPGMKSELLMVAQ